jgi:putative oxidoreductase
MCTAPTTSSTLDIAPLRRRRRIARRILTALRVLLAIEFAGAGLMKLAAAEPMIVLFDDIGAGQWLRYVVGTLELAGAVGLVLPRLAGLAALGLAALMTGALVTHVAVLDGLPVVEAVFLLGRKPRFKAAGEPHPWLWSWSCAFLSPGRPRVTLPRGASDQAKEPRPATTAPHPPSRELPRWQEIVPERSRPAFGIATAIARQGGSGGLNRLRRQDIPRS